MHRALSALAGLLLLSPGASRATFTNPAYAHDFPDPFVLKVGSTYYAYATNTGVYNIPVLTSRDLVHWKGPREAMPGIARWTLRGDIWAPSVLSLGPHRFLMYYATHDVSSAKQCIGLATSRSPAGPFRDRASRSFICTPSQGGSIDPATFRDSNGSLYIYWKNDGNCCGIATHIYVQRLSSDGLKLRTSPRSLAVNDQSWEGNVIEGPTMWKHGRGAAGTGAADVAGAGPYYLFYSGGDYATAGYAVGYSSCRSALGPCTEYPGNPILKSGCKAAGPGGETIIVDRAGHTWMAYHAWLATRVDLDPGRVLWIDRLNWPNGHPTVRGPTCTAQPVPAS